MGTLLPLLAEGGPLTGAAMPDFGRILPELWLCIMVCVVLVVDLVRGRGAGAIFPRISLVGILVAIALVVTTGGSETGDLIGYDGFPSITVDSLGMVFKLIFLVSGALTVLFIGRSREAYGNEPELHLILFGALAGMCYLAGASDMISFYLAFETVSYTGYLMAGYKLRSAKSAEAAGKYVIFGSVASAVMLFGMTLVYGYAGSMRFDEIARVLVTADATPGLIVGALFVFSGFAFKAAAFPFQFWCPDVYEGAPAPIAGFLAVASKAAAFAVGLRVLGYGMEAAYLEGSTGLRDLFSAHASVVQNVLIGSAVVTMTWGNLAALRQTNFQRMLAYSSIAHAGYLLMTCAVIGGNEGNLLGSPGNDAKTAVAFYLILYLFMNLAAFFIVTLMRRDTGSTEISALRGQGRRQPFLAICLTIILFSLTGLPPTAGFVGKLMLFAPVVHQGMYVLAAIGLVNGAISLFYYAQPLKEMYLAQVDDADVAPLAPQAPDLALVAVLTAPLLLLIFVKGAWIGAVELASNVIVAVTR